MSTQHYPDIYNDDLEEVLRVLREIVSIRIRDISDYKNLNNRFVAGRQRSDSRLAPSSPDDVLHSDQEGDIVNDAQYEYKLLNISGSLLWDRRALSVYW